MQLITELWRNLLKVIPHICIAHPFCTWFMASFSTPSCTRILKTWRICLDIELCQFKNGYSSPTSMGTPPFSSHFNELITSFAWEKIYLISIAENWKIRKIAHTRWYFLVCCLVTMPRNLVQILIKTSAFCLNQT